VIFLLEIKEKIFIKYSLIYFLIMNNMIKLKPLGDNILIEPIIEEKKSSAGIILPEMEKEKSSR
jgi:hypothetical protein